uniref:Tetraspanin 8 n=1 Tax=Amazona collaria TaxID=241587 RepID=A0A8B9FIP7_9PSIT
MAGVSSCMKYSMFIFNFLFWVCGSIILGVSIWIRVSKDAQFLPLSFQELEIDSSVFAGVDLLIAVGSIIMILGFLGCCGAIKESRCMLMLFFIGLLLILILQVTGGILGAVYRSQIETSFSKTLQESVNSLQSTTEESKVFQEKLQKFQTTVIKMITLLAYNSPFCLIFQPCGDVIINYLKDHLLIIMGIAFGLAVIEVPVHTIKIFSS